MNTYFWVSKKEQEGSIYLSSGKYLNIYPDAEIKLNNDLGGVDEAVIERGDNGEIVVIVCCDTEDQVKIEDRIKELILEPLSEITKHEVGPESCMLLFWYREVNYVDQS